MLSCSLHHLSSSNSEWFSGPVWLPEPTESAGPGRLMGGMTGSCWVCPADKCPHTPLCTDRPECLLGHRSRSLLPSVKARQREDSGRILEASRVLLSGPRKLVISQASTHTHRGKKSKVRCLPISPALLLLRRYHNLNCSHHSIRMFTCSNCS